MDHAERIAHVRHNLLAQNGQRVRRNRRFFTYLTDPTQPGSAYEAGPDHFGDRFAAVVRPLLTQIERCRAFPHAPGIVPPPGAIARRAAFKLPVDRWRVAYLAHNATGETEVRLTPAVLDDALFWYWVLVEFSDFWLTFDTPLSRFESADRFSRAYDPQYVSGSYTPGGAAGLAREYVRKITAFRSTRIGFMLNNELRLEFTVSASEIGALSQSALQHATLTTRVGYYAFQ